MRRTLKLLLPTILLLALLFTCVFVASAEEYASASVGVTEETGTTQTESETSATVLDTPVIKSFSNDGKNVTMNWDSIEGANEYRLYFKKGDTLAFITRILDGSLSYTWSDAIPGKEYTYFIQAFGEGGAQSDYDKNGFKFTAKLDTPVFTVAPFKGDVKISWTAVKDASKYKVFIKNGSSWKTIATTELTSYVYTKAEYNKKVTYTVRCVNSEGNYCSDYNKTGISYTLKLATPSNIKVATSGTAANISWDAVKDTYGYKVFYKTSSTSWKTIASTTSTSYKWTKPALGTEYTYTVRCIDKDGNYCSSFNANGVKHTVWLPAPTGIKLTNQSKSSVKVTWDKLSGAGNYRVFYKTETSGWKKMSDTTSLSYTRTGLTMDRKYYFTVRAIDKSGKKFISKYQNPGVLHMIKTAKPIISSVEKANDSAVNINIKAVDGAVKYKLYYRFVGDSGYKIIGNVSSTKATWKYVIPNQNLQYTVRSLAANGDIISDYEAGYIYKLSSTKYQTPKITSCIYTGGKITIKWNASYGNPQYKVTVKDNEESEYWTVLTRTSATSYSFKATPDIEKVYSVVALKNGENNSSWDSVHPVVADFAAPKLQKSGTTIKFAWTKIEGAVKYQIYRNYYKTSGFQYYKTVSASSNTFSDSSIEKGRQYHYKVKAVFDNEGKIYLYSKPLKTVAGLGAPAATVTSRLWRYNFKWNRNSVASGYAITFCKDNKNFKMLTSTSKLFFNSKKCGNGSVYYFRVYSYKTINGERIYGTYKPLTCKCVATAYGNSTGGNYIEVSIDQQHMWLYRNGKLVTETDVVTGNYGTSDTPKGFYTVFDRESPAVLVGPDYRTPVSFWLGFTASGCGVHDSTWRDDSEYGGTTYKGNGSHGCVNTPYSKVKVIYANSYTGIPVVVY